MMQSTSTPQRLTSDVAALICAGAFVLIVDLALDGRYGFHRDELATLDDARHLAWGYVAYPPVTPFFARLSLELFGTSLTGFRFFAALAGSIAVVLTGFMARDLGGGRRAQLLAAGATIPFSLAVGSLMQYVAFDYLCWVATAYFVVRLGKSQDPRWWIAVGASIGFGMLTKYSMLVCVAGLVIGVVGTHLRQQLRSKWLWISIACSVLVFLPNLIWQLRHDLVSLDFLRYIHERDVRIGRTKDFLPDQLALTFLAAPLAACGFYFYFFSQDGRRCRVLGWMYLVALMLFLVARGRGYYLAPAYPMLYAGGAVFVDNLLGRIDRVWSLIANAVLTMAAIANFAVPSAFVLPLAPINSRWWNAAVKINNDFVEEIGWPELVQTVAQIRDSLSEGDRARLGILTGNYGEAGAIDLYGLRYGLPSAISGINSYWGRGYGDPAPEILIAVGLSRPFLERNFQSCELAGHINNRYGVANEETKDHSEIFVCRGLRQSWPDFWKTFRHYG